MKRTNIYRPGWQQSVGWVAGTVDGEIIEDDHFAVRRIELGVLHLSHAASLFLLQGASIRQLLTDVVVRVGARDPEIYSVVFSEKPVLYHPPPCIHHVVLAHLIERTPNISPEALFERLLHREVGQRSF